MNNSHIRIENILIFALYLTVLFSLWQTFKDCIKKLRKQVKRRLGSVKNIVYLAPS